MNNPKHSYFEYKAILFRMIINCNIAIIQIIFIVHLSRTFVPYKKAHSKKYKAKYHLK